MAARWAAGRWTQNKDFCYWDYPLVELSGLTSSASSVSGGLAGLWATAAEAFGMNVAGHIADPHRPMGLSP